MQIQVFSVPMEGDEEAVAAVNRFLRAHKVLSIEKVAVQQAGRQFWSLCLEYLPKAPAAADRTHGAPATDRPRTDYRETLSAPQFQRFSKLRELRKQLADSEGLPVYTLFTNAQLAELACKVPRDRTALASIDGLGTAKVDRYGEPLLALLQSLPEPEPVSDGSGPEPTTEARPLVASET